MIEFEQERERERERKKWKKKTHLDVDFRFPFRREPPRQPRSGGVLLRSLDDLAGAARGLLDAWKGGLESVRWGVFGR